MAYDRRMTLKVTQGDCRWLDSIVYHFLLVDSSKKRLHLASFLRYHNFYTVRNCLWPWTDFSFDTTDKITSHVHFPVHDTRAGPTFCELYELEMFRTAEVTLRSLVVIITVAIRPVIIMTSY